MDKHGMLNYSKPELLSPAGDPERLEAAVLYGADAVYVGARDFGMRAGAKNFTFDELRAAAARLHACGKRLYLTCNTLPTCAEMDAMPQFLQSAAACGVDAFIVSDVGVLALIKRLLPDAEIHISTQAGVVNYAAANAFFEMGASRVVLARELSLDEICRLRDKTDSRLELECFVHGAMCMSFSGRCTISDYLTARNANRGECSQPCRWQYALMEQKRPGEYFPVVEEKNGTYILNSRDLCMIGFLDRLWDAGISSFKIEGRAKSAYYTATVTGAYRGVLDILEKTGKMPQGEDSWLLQEVFRVSHREYCTGFYFGQPGQCYQTDGSVRGWEFGGVVTDCRDDRLFFAARNMLVEGQQIEVLMPGVRPQTAVVCELSDENGQRVQSANHPTANYSIRWSCSPVPAGSILRYDP